MYASYENDFCIEIEDIQHYNCVRGLYFHERLAMRPGQVVWEHIRNIMWAIARYLEDVPNNCLRFEDNRAIFILLTLKGALKWH